MRVFNACCKVIRRRASALLIYLVIFLTLSIVLTSFSTSENSTDFSGTKTKEMCIRDSTTILSYKIFKEFSLKRWGLLIPFAIVCFHPSLILLSGSINNDMLCLTFMMASILMAIRWYKNPRIRTILPVALCIGLAMMSKFSGALVAPAVAFLFQMCIRDRFCARPIAR